MRPEIHFTPPRHGCCHTRSCGDTQHHPFRVPVPVVNPNPVQTQEVNHTFPPCPHPDMLVKCLSMLDVRRLDPQCDCLAVDEYLCNHHGDEVLQWEGESTRKRCDLQWDGGGDVTDVLTCCSHGGGWRFLLKGCNGIAVASRLKAR